MCRDTFVSWLVETNLVNGIVGAHVWQLLLHTSWSELCTQLVSCTGVGSGGAWGAAPPYKFASMGLGNKVWNKTASGYPQWYGTEAHRVFFRPAPRRTATVVQGKLALPDSWRMPRLHDTWRRGLCRTITCTAAPRVCHLSPFTIRWIDW